MVGTGRLWYREAMYTPYIPPRGYREVHTRHIHHRSTQGGTYPAYTPPGYTTGCTMDTWVYHRVYNGHTGCTTGCIPGHTTGCILAIPQGVPKEGDPLRREVPILPTRKRRTLCAERLSASLGKREESSAQRGSPPP